MSTTTTGCAFAPRVSLQESLKHRSRRLTAPADWADPNGETPGTRRWWRRYQVALPPMKFGRWRLDVREQPIDVDTGVLASIESGGRLTPPQYAGTYRTLYRREMKPSTFYSEAEGEDRTVIREKDVLWMADSAAELYDQAEAFDRFAGDVLIGGLGIGAAVKAALAKPEVRSVTVIELDEAIAQNVAPHYADPRLQIVHGDAMAWDEPGRTFDVAWFDIWAYVCAGNLPEMMQLSNRWEKRAGWMGFWCLDWCIEQLVSKARRVFHLKLADGVVEHFRRQGVLREEDAAALYPNEEDIERALFLEDSPSPPVTP
jgi:hypothetical protein